MANHTSAEAERIKKRNARQQRVLECVFAAGLGVVLLIACFYNKRIADREKAALAAPTEDPALSDVRVMYLLNFAESGYSLDDKAARIALTDSNGQPAQLVAYQKDGSLCVKYVFAPQIRSSEDDGSDIFPGITEETEPPKVDRGIAEEAARYFIPLIGEEYREALISGVSSALAETQAGKSFKQSFIAGVYSFTADYSASDGLLTISAEPS